MYQDVNRVVVRGTTSFVRMAQLVEFVEAWLAKNPDRTVIAADGRDIRILKDNFRGERRVRVVAARPESVLGLNPGLWVLNNTDDMRLGFYKEVLNRARLRGSRIVESD